MSAKKGQKQNRTASRHAWFVEEYFRNRQDATAAARAIGVPDKAARNAGYTLLHTPTVQELVEARRRELIQAARVGSEDVVKQAAIILRADLRQLLDAEGQLRPPSEWPDDIAPAVQSYEVTQQLDKDGAVRQIRRRVVLTDKNPAMRSAAVFLGMVNQPVPLRELPEERDPVESARKMLFVLNMADAAAGKEHVGVVGYSEYESTRQKAVMRDSVPEQPRPAPSRPAPPIEDATIIAERVAAGERIDDIRDGADYGKHLHEAGQFEREMEPRAAKRPNVVARAVGFLSRQRG